MTERNINVCESYSGDGITCLGTYADLTLYRITTYAALASIPFDPENGNETCTSFIGGGESTFNSNISDTVRLYVITELHGTTEKVKYGILYNAGALNDCTIRASWDESENKLVNIKLNVIFENTNLNKPQIIEHAYLALLHTSGDFELSGNFKDGFIYNDENELTGFDPLLRGTWESNEIENNEITIPENIVAVNENSLKFVRDANLTINIPENVKRFSQNAFGGEFNGKINIWCSQEECPTEINLLAVNADQITWECNLSDEERNARKQAQIESALQELKTAADAIPDPIVLTAECWDAISAADAIINNDSITQLSSSMPTEFNELTNKVAEAKEKYKQLLNQREGKLKYYKNIFRYKIIKDGVWITYMNVSKLLEENPSVDSSWLEVELPSEIQGMPVVGIDSYSFVYDKTSDPESYPLGLRITGGDNLKNVKKNAFIVYTTRSGYFRFSNATGYRSNISWYNTIKQSQVLDWETDLAAERERKRQEYEASLNAENNTEAESEEEN